MYKILGYRQLEKYELKSGEQLAVFEFISVGSNGRIKKLVQYTITNSKDLYNLGFGDKNIDTGEIDDNVISNNGDSEKVLAIVVATLYVKFKNYWIMNITDLNTKKKLVILIDKSMDFFNDKVLFPDKLAKANEMLKKVGLPKMNKVL